MFLRGGHPADSARAEREPEQSEASNHNDPDAGFGYRASALCSQLHSRVQVVDLERIFPRAEVDLVHGPQELEEKVKIGVWRFLAATILGIADKNVVQ